VAKLVGHPAAAPFRRRLVLRRTPEGAVEGAIEDHIHHFQVRVEHRDGRVTAVEGRAVRAPWTLCPGAGAQLAELVGTAVGSQARSGDPTAHCTHLLDLAVVAIRFVADRAVARRFDLTVTGWERAERTATARRDDGLTIRWTVREDTITDPPPYAGRALGAGFTSWAATALDADEAEMALLLRRATWMSASRGIDLDRFDRLSESALPPGSCFASQPERIDLALRNRGSTLRELGPPGG